jgi:hypothetical protein
MARFPTREADVATLQWQPATSVQKQGLLAVTLCSCSLCYSVLDSRQSTGAADRRRCGSPLRV